MSTAVLEAPTSAVVLETPTSASAPAQEEVVPRKKWTRSECRQLMEMGILEEARFELIHGDIIPKMTQHERHIYTCKQVQKALEAIFGADYVRLANPIAIGDYEEPEPDAAVMQRPLIDYLRMGTPLPQEARLVVEVSDSTLRWDLSTKREQYGSAGIPEYWVVDIPNRLLHVFQQPTASGYAEEAILTTDEEVCSLAAPDAAIRVADLLP